jgi:LuxR family maltose regulon positive regulatory protein
MYTLQRSVGERIPFQFRYVLGSMMARTTQAALIWLQEQQSYLWRDAQCGEAGEAPILHEETETWLQWLASHTSFSFRGREGQLTMLKETRPRGGDGYWYAYRRQGKRTIKKYAGRTTDLTFARLERTARALLSLPERDGQSQHSVWPEDARRESEETDWQAMDLSQRGQKESSTSLQDPLLLSKLHLPPLHSSLILRERLLVMLDRGLEHRLTLVSAPAGFGKTTLVRQWVAERSKQKHFPPVAWVSLDARDNDPVRFWRYLMTACQAFRDDLAQAALTVLHTIPQPPFESSLIETALADFLNALVLCEQGGILVLDDYHVITSPQIQETMTFFLNYLPASIHVIIITRSDPPFPLVRLRARDELYEVRTPDLRFSQEETAAFLRQTMAFPLAPKTVQRISTHIEGWAAGLRLLLLTLQERPALTEIEPFFRTFAGGQRALQEYFLAEVFDSQPERVQRFLLQTSVLGRLTGSLCNALTGESDSELLLERLEQANLFLEPLDSGRQWYRYHGLFAEAMQQEARHRLGEDTLRTLSSHASHWYEAHSLHAEAVETALHAQDYARAAILIEQLLEASHINEYHTLYHWLEQIPESLIKRHPVLCLEYAAALLLVVVTWQPPQTTLTRLEKFLLMAEECFRAEHNLPKLGEVFAFRSLIAWRQDEVVQAGFYARQALRWLSIEQRNWRSLSLSMVGKAEFLYHGRVDEAHRMLEEAAALCEAVDNQYFKHATTNMLASVFFEQGALHRAAEYYQRALSEARERAHNDDIAYALLGLARISYERNELETARQQAEEALAIGQYLAHERTEIQVTLLLARIHYARGETMATQQRLTALLAKLPATQPDHVSPLIREILTLQALLALASNDLASVQRWLADSGQFQGTLSPFSAEREALVLARWHLVQGREEEALKILHGLLTEAQAMGRKRSAFEIQALRVVAYAARTQRTEALQNLQELLKQTYPEGFLRLYVDEGEAMATLLHTLVAHVREKPLLAYIQTILRCFPGAQEVRGTPSAVPLQEPLSVQERRVLRQLALGRSNAEIAGELVVSVNTVRTQVQSIYRKLDVHNRAAAGEVARQLGLM